MFPFFFSPTLFAFFYSFSPPIHCFSFFSFVRLTQAKLETKALKAKRPGFTDERYHETSYYIENGKLFELLRAAEKKRRAEATFYLVCSSFALDPYVTSVVH